MAQCQGTPNISDVYAAALWSVDYTLYASTLKISRLHFHMGTPYRYSAWQPITLNDTAPHVKPLYYGNLMVASAFAGGGGKKQVVSLLNESSWLTAYGVYDYDGDGGGGLLGAVVVVNLEGWNSTQDGERPGVRVKLPEVEGDGVGWEGAKVRRLTAPGVEVKTGVEFAGRTVDGQGNLVGEEVLEEVEGGGWVRVAAGEAVLVTR
ncbi:MAG: hypothetical protein Q9227_004751 [Pyrenula ochraceoflavens]